MNRANIIITSVKVNAELTRQAMTVKSDGRNCSYKLKHIGHPTDANYDADLAEAKPATDVFPIPMNTADPQFKENLALSKFRNTLTIEDARVDKMMYDTLAATLGEALMSLFIKSPWAQHKNQHTFVELFAYYRMDILKVAPSTIEEIKAASVYDTRLSFDENMAILLTIIDALQPHDATTTYQQMKMLRDMVERQPAAMMAYEHYLSQNPMIEGQSIQEAINSISIQVKNNPKKAAVHTSSINSVQHEEMMEINHQLMQVQANQEARINQLIAAMAANSNAPPPAAPRVTTKYCHFHGSNNTHNGAECKKMGSPGFTIKGTAVTPSMIANRVPGAVVDGVTGKM